MSYRFFCTLESIEDRSMGVLVSIILKTKTFSKVVIFQVFWLFQHLDLLQEMIQAPL